MGSGDLFEEIVLLLLENYGVLGILHASKDLQYQLAWVKFRGVAAA